MNGWHHASTREPCPICGKDSWCSLSDDGKVCVCQRTPGERPTKIGHGWIYWLDRGGQTRRGGVLASSVNGISNSSAEQAGTPALRAAEPDVDAYFHKLATGNEQVRLSRYLMRTLSIPSGLFAAMDVRWDHKAKAIAFPMRDAHGKVTGIRYRSAETGKKWAFRGGHDGLFYVPERFATGALKGLPQSELYVCEGPTDALAATAIGLLNVVGRSCCTSGAALVKELAERHGLKRVTVIADDDTPKTRPDGSTFTPGIDGARRLAADIGLDCRIVFPAKGYKDLRDWYAKGGLTYESFMSDAREVGVKEK